jgi:hypothetical protein
VRKRAVFAAPFVVVTSCDRPIERREREVEAPAEVVTRAPDTLVDELQPLGKVTVHDAPLCNPPPPTGRCRPQIPNPVKPQRLGVVAMKRESTGTRVRLQRPDLRMDHTWRAAFLTTLAAEVPDGECTIVAWSDRELECTTRVQPEQLAANGTTFDVWIEPPADLVLRVEREREHRLPQSPP